MLISQYVQLPPPTVQLGECSCMRNNFDADKHDGCINFYVLLYVMQREVGEGSTD